VLESAGIEFDHLWVMGLTDEAWPIHPRPNPFLPLEAQRQARVPEASSSHARARCRHHARLAWRRARGGAVASQAEGERKLLPVPAAARSGEAVLRCPHMRAIAT
jgi:hypothetical protein